MIEKFSPDVETKNLFQANEFEHFMITSGDYLLDPINLDDCTELQEDAIPNGAITAYVPLNWLQPEVGDTKHRPLDDHEFGELLQTAHQYASNNFESFHLQFIDRKIFHKTFGESTPVLFLVSNSNSYST